MKKTIIGLACGLMLSTNVFANDIYIGITGGMATDQESFNVDRVGLEDWDTCYLYGAKLGIELNRYLALELVVDRLDKFEINSNMQGIKADMRMTNYLAMIKLSTAPRKVRAYLRAGAGLADIGMMASMVGGGKPVFEDDEVGAITRFGIGTDVFVSDSISMGFNVNYTNGLHEIETLECLVYL